MSGRKKPSQKKRSSAEMGGKGGGSAEKKRKDEGGAGTAKKSKKSTAKKAGRKQSGTVSTKAARRIKVKEEERNQKFDQLYKKAMKKAPKHWQIEQDEKPKKYRKKFEFKLRGLKYRNRDGGAKRDDDSEEEPSTGPGHTHEYEKLNRWRPSNMLVAKIICLMDRKEEVRKRLGVRYVAERCEVPRNTLNKRVREEVRGISHMSGGIDQPRKLTPEQEQALKEHLLKNADIAFPLTPKLTRVVANEFGEELQKENWKTPKEMALSRMWQKGFFQRNPEIALRMPQGISKQRAVAADEEKVHSWFERVADVFERKGIRSPLQVWNLDETGVVDVPRVQKVIARKGGKVNLMRSKEQGTTTTIVCLVNAIGLKVPPMVIHKNVNGNVQPSWVINCGDAIVTASENGWVNKGLVRTYGRHFLRFLKDNNLLDMEHALFLDGHTTHTSNVEFLQEMAKAGVNVICFPAHTSHFLQPLDGPPLGIFKRTWMDELTMYMRKYGGQALLKAHWFGVFNRAWRSITPGTIVRGFRECGIWPLNFLVIHKDHFFTKAAEPRREPLQAIQGPAPPPPPAPGAQQQNQNQPLLPEEQLLPDIPEPLMRPSETSTTFSFLLVFFLCLFLFLFCFFGGFSDPVK